MNLVLIGFMNAAILGFAFQHGGYTSSEPLLHVRHGFEFTVHAPLKAAAPLFGAHAERAWAGAEWNPQFIYPQHPEDRAGAVFTVERVNHKSTWINTIFDLEKGHVQYVYFIPDALVTFIDIHLVERDASTTNVSVVYERTALNAEANAHVKQMGESDAKAGKEWETSINDYFIQQKLADRK